MMRKARRRELESMSLSLLDVISCGFGAVILMLVLTRIFEPVQLAETSVQLEEQLSALQQRTLELGGAATRVNRRLLSEEARLASARSLLARLEARLAGLSAEMNRATADARTNNAVETALAKAEQSLTEEMERLLADYRRSSLDNTVGGIPVDSEYVIFIIDTSGSMFGLAWPLVMQKMAETLELYPQLKGIQVMNDMGNYMFPEYANNWIPDTQVRRKQIIARLENWNSFSNSSPVEGINKAIATFHKPDRKISLYVFGDEFSGRSVQSVIKVVDRINRTGAGGEQLVRIHAVGFPVMFSQPRRFQETGIKFAILMRELCARNGGTFVGLNQFTL